MLRCSWHIRFGGQSHTSTAHTAQVLPLMVPPQVEETMLASMQLVRCKNGYHSEVHLPPLPFTLFLGSALLLPDPFT